MNICQPQHEAISCSPPTPRSCMVLHDVWISTGWSLKMQPCCSYVALACLMQMLCLSVLLNKSAYKPQRSPRCLEDIPSPSTRPEHISRKTEPICIATLSSTPRDECTC